MDHCHLSSWPRLVDGVYRYPVCASEVHPNSFDASSWNQKRIRFSMFFHLSCTWPTQRFQLQSRRVCPSPSILRVGIHCCFFSSTFGHISTSRRLFCPSYLLLQTIIFTPLILFIWPSNTGHYQKTLLPEQVEWGTSCAWAIFLTHLEAVWPGFYT